MSFQHQYQSPPQQEPQPNPLLPAPTNGRNIMPQQTLNNYPLPTGLNASNGLVSQVDGQQHPHPTAIKQQFLPPPTHHQQQQQQPLLRQQLYTNGGVGADSSNNSSRTASPAFNQPLNSAYLPASQQQLRPNVYGGVATQQNSVSSVPPPIISSSQPSPNNYYGHPVAKQGLNPNLPRSNIATPTSVPNLASPLIQPNVEKLTNNMQNIQLNSHSNGTATPPNNKQNYQPQQQQQQQQQQQPPPQQQQQSTHSMANKFNGHPASGQRHISLGSQPQQLNGSTLPNTNVPPSVPQTQLPLTPAMNPSQALYGNSQPINQYQQQPNFHQFNNQQQNQLNTNNNNNQPSPYLASTPLQPQQQQQQQQNYLNSQLPPPPPPSNLGTGSVTSNTTVGKRPLYPSQPAAASNQPIQTQPYNNSTPYYTQQNQPLPPQQQQPQQQQAQQQYQQYATNQQYQQQQQQSNVGGVVHQGFNSLWGQNTIDLMQQRHILPTLPIEPPKINLDHEFYESVNCTSDILRCTLTKIPESNSLLQKSRLPLGILIHPFRDLNNLPVIQCSTIVRCRSCRTYINPFVYFVDSKKWKCNLCYRVNELPEEFQYDPVSKSYGDVTRRPEVKSSTIEFIAPSEYMLRPPQPPIYLFLLDVSLIAQQSGYLKSVCESLAEHLESLPGDARTQIGFIAYDSAVHFYSIAEGFNQPHEITVVDIEDAFLPFPDNLLINLKESKELIKDLLNLLPTRFAQSHDTNSALGAALHVAFKLMQQTGGRVTVFQTCLPNIGPGALQSRENPNERSAKDVNHLGPAIDFYKRQALECSGHQIAVDLFLLNSQYSDLATISGISKFSGGCIHHFPLFSATKPQQVDSFKRCFERYLTRKIGFESVMRVRCSRGLAIHTFHGNFFVRSTDLLSLPNVNPDAGFGMQISYEENLGENKTVCFQAALLYTSSKGERRIRVHTLCLPVSSSLTDIIYSADAQAIIGLISKMAVDRSLQSNLTDARDAFINASCDIFSAFRLAQNIKQMSGQLLAPSNLALLPLYMLALLKHTAFRTGTSTRLDDRVFAMCDLKTLPLDQLIRYIYPDLYHLDCLFGDNNNETGEDQGNDRMEPPILQLSAEFLKSRSLFLLDCGTSMLLLVGSHVPETTLKNVFGVLSINEIPDLCYELPNTGTSDSENLHSFLESINVEKPYTPTIQIIRDNSPYRSMFTEKLVDDRNESSLSYYEFLQHLRSQIK